MIICVNASWLIRSKDLNSTLFSSALSNNAPLQLCVLFSFQYSLFLLKFFLLLHLLKSLFLLQFSLSALLSLVHELFHFLFFLLFSLSSLIFFIQCDTLCIGETYFIGYLGGHYGGFMLGLVRLLVHKHWGLLQG